MKLSGLMMGAFVGGLLAAPVGVRAADDEVNTPGPIDSVQDLQDTGKMVFKMADTNNDNKISQKEAVDAGNLLVGGFFFRADADGNGVVSRDEAQQARDALLRQKPLLRIVLERAPKSGSGEGNEQAQDAMQGFMSLVDANNDGQLQATELRQLVQTSVQGLYAQADTDRDGHLTPSELNASVQGMAQAAAEASFQAADADNDGSLSKEEFDKMIIEPARVVFRIIDADGDGKISKQEAQSAQRTVNRQLQMINVPEPDNSLSNQIDNATQRGGNQAIGSPRTPNRTTPNAPQPRRPAAPGAPSQPQ
jgi:Ca2+-binding EF-hand superfamily protein